MLFSDYIIAIFCCYTEARRTLASFVAQQSVASIVDLYLVILGVIDRSKIID